MEKNFTLDLNRPVFLRDRLIKWAGIMLLLIMGLQAGNILFAEKAGNLFSLKQAATPIAAIPGSDIAICSPGDLYGENGLNQSFNPGFVAQESATSATTISWGTAASQPYNVSEAQGEVVNGKLYSFGGFDSQKTGFTPTSRAYVFDPAANTWKALAAMPPMNSTNYGGVTHAGFATDGKDIYFAGGYTSNATGTGQIFGSKEAWKYIVAENRYVRLPNLPIQIAAGQMEYLNGKLHHIGGTNLSRTQDLGNHYVLDLSNTSAGWKTLAPVPNARQHAGSAVLGGKIYYIGGQTGHDSKLVAQKYVHSYNPSTNTWTRVADLPVPSGATGRGHISSAVVVYNNRILVLAGETVFNAGYTNMVSAYSPSTNTWENLTPMPVARYSGVAAYINGNLYYTGGSKTRTTYKGKITETTSPDPTTDLLSGVSATSSRSYTLAKLATGAATYTDRTYKITNVPSLLSGAEYIRTPNDDKSSTAASLVTVKLSKKATLYAAYDPRATARPSWLSTWTKRTERLGVEDSKISYLDLYSKTYEAGTITFGGNMASPAAGSQTNYIIIAKATTTATEEEPAPEDPPVMAGSGDAKINFQTSSSGSVSGYLADTGQPFDTNRGYGWVNPSTKAPVNLSANMRLRSGTTDLRLRTLVQMQDNTNGQVPGTWEYVIPNGTYNVGVSVGDPNYYDSSHRINVEGKTAISGFVPSSQTKFRAATVQVQVSDGRLTIDAAGGTNTKLNYVTIASATPTAASTNGFLVLENMDKFPAADQLTFSKIQTPWRRTSPSVTPYNANHDKVRLRLHNKGTGALKINGLSLSNTALWKISALNGAAYSSSALPLTINSKAYAELEIEFIAKDQATRVKVLQGSLRISSNDSEAPEKDVTLYGLWQLKGEGSSEPWANEIISAFGFKTRVGFNSNDGTSDGKTIVANSDEIISAYFVRANPSLPVRVVQMAAYHGCCSSTETIQWHAKGSTTNTTIFSHNPLDGQSLLPRKSGSSTVVAEGSFSPSGAFGLKMQKSYTDRTKNYDGRIAVRIWKAKDASGRVIPNAYLMGMDYLGTTYTNYDYQDNIYFVSNIKPETGPAHYSELSATPSAFTFNTLAVGANQVKAISLKNLGKSYTSGSDPSVQISSIQIAGPNASDFTAGSPGTTTLGVQSTTSINVTFKPGSPGLKNAVLLVYYNNAGSPLRVPLYGIAQNGSTTFSLAKRIKGAANSNVTIAGKVWEADINYRKGSIKLDKQIVAGPIAATDEDVLYQTYLSAAANLAETRYDIPVANGNYRVRMHLVENYFNASGSRVFSVTAEGKLAVPYVDIFSEVGYRSAYVKDIAVTVTDGVMNFRFNPTADRVAIAGLEIYKVNGTNPAAVQQAYSSILDAPVTRNLQVYPNPAQGKEVNLALEGFEAQEKVSVQVFDMAGRVVQTIEIITDELGAYNASLQLSNSLQGGIYLIKASAASGGSSTKLILE
ncbi:malectin domain-containing carbohydrate-binding protein [Pontibacter arcticus]|uniref:Por secretion system C-terminal sorting domain-containing protein n=1 Tax=Pontibacter arcticus TaxID=2080288 RepID=A0A364RDS4_9BACT|nr:malectin domain-containing carbohydrate-binding protein [Pontibacter arcticus]RAU82424.1 hypothetical protein DP923_11610 [Pontibacter arcticus]